MYFRVFSNGDEIVVFTGATLQFQTCGAQGFDQEMSENDHFSTTFLTIFHEFLDILDISGHFHEFLDILDILVTLGC